MTVTPPPGSRPPLEQGDGTLAHSDNVIGEVLHGVRGYRAFQMRVADDVSPAEALDAERNCTRARRAMFASVLVVLALQFAKEAALRWAGLPVFHVLDDVSWFVGLIAPLVLGRLLGMPYAGRIHVLLLAGFLLTSPLEAPLDGFGTWYWARFIALVLGAYGVGWAVDFGAAPGDGWPRARRYTLVAVGVGVVAYAAAVSIVGAPVPTLTLIASLAYLSAPVWPASLARRGLSLQSIDAQTVFDAAISRWGHLLRGRTLAALLGLLPAFMFLANVGMRERLEVPHAGGSAEHAAPSEHHEPIPNPHFWIRRGHPLTDLDLATDEIYQFKWKIEASKPSSESAFVRASQLVTAVREDPYDAASFSALREILAGSRLTKISELVAIGGVTDEDRRNDVGGILHVHLAEIPSGPPRSGVPQPTFYVAEDLHEPILKPMSRQWRELKIAEAELTQWPLIAFGVLGFILLWRRGGDSPTARWTGLWLIGCTAVATYAFAELSVPGPQWYLWSRASVSPIAAFGLRAFLLLLGAGFVLQVITVPGLALWALWAHLCWPTPVKKGQSPWRRRLVTAGKVAAVSAIACGVLVIAYVTAWITKEITKEQLYRMLFPVIAVIGTNLLMFIVGRALRKRFASDSEVPQALGWKAISAFIAAELVGLSILFADLFVHGGIPTWVFWLTRALAAIFFALGVAAILRPNFLRLGAGKDIPFAILACFLPIALQISEHVVKEYIEHTPFMSESGGRILGVICVAMLIGPTEHLLERIVLRLSVKRLKRVEHAVEEAVEELAHAATPRDAAHSIASAFANLGIRSFLFYIRTGPHEFQLLLAGGAERTPQLFEMSGHALGAFGRERRFIDLENVAFEWPTFFQQFELYRLERLTGMRYIMSVNLKSSVCGFLLLPGTDEAAAVSSDAVAEEINDLGVAAARTRR